MVSSVLRPKIPTPIHSPHSHFLLPGLCVCSYAPRNRPSLQPPPQLIVQYMCRCLFSGFPRNRSPFMLPHAIRPSMIQELRVPYARRFFIHRLPHVRRCRLTYRLVQGVAPLSFSYSPRNFRKPKKKLHKNTPKFKKADTEKQPEKKYKPYAVTDY